MIGVVHLVGSVGDLARFIQLVKDPSEPYVVLLAGASASGKSTTAQRLVEELDRLRVPVVRKGGRPSPVEADMFYRDDSSQISEVLGGNYDHPMEIDVHELERVVYHLVEGREVWLPKYDFRTGRRTGKVGPLVPDENPVIVVEGLYVIGLLGDLSNVNVFVETNSKMELLIRRLLRDVERKGADKGSILRTASTALAMWNVYGESQKRRADILLRSSYSVLVDKGEPSYQVKVSEGDFQQAYPGTWDDLRRRRPERVEDLIIGDAEEQMRGRLRFEGGKPSSFELSYRMLVAGDVPFTQSLRVSLPTASYTAFVTLSQIMGYRPRVHYREIHSISWEGGTLKWYPDKEMVEFDSRTQGSVLRFIEKMKGRIRLRSYYQDEI